MPGSALFWALRLYALIRDGAFADKDDVAYYDVAIVGAGISGITAAATLAKEGKSVVVLEAADRVGGRTYTGHPFGFPVDLGGAWIHSGTQNPNYKLATELGLKPAKTDWDNFLVLRHGVEQADWPHYDKFEQLMRQLTEDANTLGWDQTLESAFQKHLLHYPDADEKSWIQFYMRNEIAADNGDELQHLSLKGSLATGGHECTNSDKGWDWYNAEDVDSDFLLPSGYLQIWNAIKDGAEIPVEGDPMRRLSAKQVISVPSAGREWEIWTNSKVTKIVYAGDKAVLSSEGQMPLVEVSAVVVTVSIGVLKSGSIVFDPPLSKAKQTALAHSAMGSYEKLLLKFPSIPEPLKSAPGVFDVSSSLQKWIGEFINLQSYTDIAQPVIVGTVHGDTARRLQAMNMKSAVDETMTALKKDFPALPDPVDWFKTNWTSNPFTLGSYSNWPPELTLADKLALQAPEKTAGKALLVFAGEGTQICDLGTVHGAAFSGLRASSLVLGKTRKHSWLKKGLGSSSFGILAAIVAVIVCAIVPCCIYFLCCMSKDSYAEADEDDEFDGSEGDE